MNLERIEITPFAILVGDIVQSRRTGYLTIIRPPSVRTVLYWSQGELVLVTSAVQEESLGDFLVRRGILSADRAFQMITDDPTDAVAKFHEAGMLELSWRQSLLREWIAALFIPLFSLDEGTAAFTDDSAIEPEKRVFLQSTGAMILDGIRSITNGLVLRRSLGDLKREITYSHDSRFDIEHIPLTDSERRVAASLAPGQTLEVFLRQFANESVIAAKTAIGMLTLGIFEIVDERNRGSDAMASMDDMQRDLELLAAIGSNDTRTLRAVAFSRQINNLDHYQVLDVPRAATRAQVIAQGEVIKKKYDLQTFPSVAREAVQTIIRRIDQALVVLRDGVQRQAYDKLLAERGSRGGSDDLLKQRLAQRSIAQENYTKARELAIAGDYYAAIVLLKQAVQYAPDDARSWHLLGTCQERNPRWRREASLSFQKALSIDPNSTDILISLGDLYRAEGLVARAQSCYEDVLKITPDHQEARNRLVATGRK